MIRRATIHDLPAIAKVHSICFPDSYSSQLGKLKNVMGGVIYWFLSTESI